MLNRLLGLLGWAGTALVFAALFVRMVLPDRQQLWWWLSIAGLALVVLYSLSQWREIARMMSRRQARYGTLATSSVLIALGIVVAVNYVLARQNKRWDLTAAGQYSLSDQTKQVLRGLTEPIKVIVFAREDEFPRYRDRLGEYVYTSSQVSVEYVDVDKQPLLAKQYEVQSYGTVVFDYQGRVERVVSDAEQDLTNGLIKVVEGKPRVASFVQGHGEKDPTATDRNGYSALQDALKLDNFSVSTFVLAQEGKVPDDASVVIVAGPKTDLLPGEIEALRGYLERGGKVLFLLDPPESDDAPALTNTTAFLKDWGIEVGSDVVVDVSGVGQLIGTDASVPVAATYPAHAITDRFNLLTAFPLTRSVKPVSGGATGRVAQTFVETSARSWAESSLAELATGEVAMNADEGDTAGPISIAVAVSVPVPKSDTSTSTDEKKDETADDAPQPESRLAVFGDSDFASNAAVGIQGNRDLVLNAINWLAQQENLISIRPREPEDRRITLTADQQFRIQLLSIFLVPGVVLGLGIYTWWRRR
jgi:ABC-type uncharacterized transport system involved in gliding motility auxiliary subunit